MLRRWLLWERRQALAHWREDAALGFAVGLAVAGPVLAWIGIR